MAGTQGRLVSAAIPSRDEAHAIFGIDLSSKNVQPVWLEIENNSNLGLHFMRTGLDPEYFSPREVGFAFHGSLSDESKKHLAWHLEGLNFENPIQPGSTVSGFVYTNESKETKFVSVDLLGRGWSGHLTLLVPVPDRLLSEDHIARVEAMLSDSKPLHVEKASELRTELEKLPCCTASEDGVEGVPLNVVLIGELATVGPALARRHFRYLPASPLYVFGRSQDFSLRKGDMWVAAQPHMLRAWLTNIRFQGKIVWIGQVRTPLGGRFASDDDVSSPLSDPDVDEVRNDVVQDAIYSQLLVEIGFVKGAGAVSRSSPRATPGGSSYYTDGLRAVLVFDRDPVSMREIEIMNWERLVDHQDQ